MKIAVVVDSASDYFNQDIQMEGLFAIPLQIIQGDESFKESVEITNDQVNNLMQRGKDLKTSLPILGELEVLFQDIKDQGYTQIFATPITRGISGTLDTMRVAANSVDISFDAFDCYTAMLIELECALAARKLFDKGYDIPEVKKRLNEAILKSDTFIVPNDLDHLSKGGRLSPLAAKLGGLLRIKPILHLNHLSEGVIDPFDKVRTMSKAIDTVIKEMQAQGVDETYQITLVDVNNPTERDKTETKLRETFPKTDISVTQLISTVSVHVGIGTLAFQYLKKIDLT